MFVITEGSRKMVASCEQYHHWSSSYLQLSGCTVEYVSRGTGEPLVLVPGLAGGVELLEPLIARLSRRYRVVACQLRGESWGFCQTTFGLGQLVGDLRSLVKTLRLERPAMVGVSFGGAIALEYAARFPGSLAFLAVQGTATRFQANLFGEVCRQVLDRMLLPDDNPFINQFFRVLVGHRPKPTDRFDFIVDRCWRTDQSVMAQRLALLDQYDVGDRLDDLSTPTLVLSGAQDVVVSPAESQELARLLPDGHFETVPGAGHLAFVTHSNQLGRRIERFDRACLSA